MNIRKTIEFLSSILLLLCISVLPIYILITFQTNKDIIVHVNDINQLFLQLEQSHKANAEILFDSLEFRRIEYNCYFSAENTEFNKAFNISQKKYLEYLAHDKKLSPENKKLLIQYMSIVEETFNARLQLMNKLSQYESKRPTYLKLHFTNAENIIKSMEKKHNANCNICSKNNNEKSENMEKTNTSFTGEVKKVLTPIEPITKILDRPIPIKDKEIEIENKNIEK